MSEPLTPSRLDELRRHAETLTYYPTRHAAFELLGEIDRLRIVEAAALSLYYSLSDVRDRYPEDAPRCPFMMGLSADGPEPPQAPPHHPPHQRPTLTR
jgi:hypothetical protein